EESFENDEIADYLNRNYIAIKVDREVRPDIDETYMSAVQLLTGGGGWPMTVWLTPVRQPFSGGTYFPPKQFLAVLQQLRVAFDAAPPRAPAGAGAPPRRPRDVGAPRGGARLPEGGVLGGAFDRSGGASPPPNGGFGPPPNSPPPPVLDFLLRYHRRTG